MNTNSLVVGPLMADLLARVKAVPEVGTNAMQVYDQKQLAGVAVKVVPPFIGVVYSGMNSASTNNSGVGAAVQVVFEVIVVGADACKLCLGDDQVVDKTTYILDQLRAAIVGSLSPVPSSRRWAFIAENAARISLDGKREELGYIQRWGTASVLPGLR